MLKLLLGICFAVFSLGALAADLPAIAALEAFRAPMDAMAREAGKGNEASFDAFSSSWTDADKAWKAFVAEPLELDRYGVPAERQDDAWRKVRMMALLVRTIDEGIGRGNFALARRAAGMLPQAWAELRAALNSK